MNPPSSAEQNLAVIRTLMERSAVYRRALGPILVTVGGLGVVAAAAGVILKIEESLAFILFWLGVALVAVVLAFILSRRQALREGEPFWSVPTRQVATALAPPLLLGVIFSIPSAPPGCIVVWLLAYGMGLHAAGFVAPTGLRYLGWVLIAMALVLAFGPDMRNELDPAVLPRDQFVMGIAFGLPHLIYGGLILLTERRAPTP